MEKLGYEGDRRKDKMEDRIFQNIPGATMEHFCRLIEILDPCMDDYLYIMDLKNDEYFISPSACARFHMKENNFHNAVKAHEEFVYSEDILMLQDDLKKMLAGEKSFHDLQYRWLDKEGQPIWINCRGKVLFDAEGAPEYMIGCINEIGTKQRADNVSGLLGESSLRYYMWNFCGKLPDGYILRIGIDNFKDINENKGMEYGDVVLKKTAECISRHIGQTQRLYRGTADEFIITDFSGGSQKEAYKFYKTIREEIDRFIEKNYYEAVYTVSGGIISCGSVEDQSYSNMMKLSEFSLSEAKRRGKNRCYIFKQEDYDAFLRKKKIIQIMRHSIYNNFVGFETYFQPVVDTRTGRLTGAETLLRFRSEELGSIFPVEFIPILEETGLIIPVGKWVLHQALLFCREVRSQIKDFKVSVNLSYVQVMKSNILAEIISNIEAYGLDPSSLVIELTESGFVESDMNFKKLCSGLREYGIALSLDDFGTGYSNFHYLYDLSPNIIKIDRSFTVKALSNDYEHSMLNHIIDMVHSIELKLCVEGIETKEELEKISQMNPDYIQGYYFGRPCPQDVFMGQFVNHEV